MLVKINLYYNEISIHLILKLNTLFKNKFLFYKKNIRNSLLRIEENSVKRYWLWFLFERFFKKYKYGLVEVFNKKIVKGWIRKKGDDQYIFVKVNGKIIDKIYPGKKNFGRNKKILGFSRVLEDLWKYIGKDDVVQFEYGGNLIPIGNVGFNYFRSKNSKRKSKVEKLFEKIEKGFVFNKYGRLKLSILNNNFWKDSIFSLFFSLKDLLKKEFNLELFPIYGTMLGAAREGDFISHDNDFDTCYISKEKEPAKVKNEFIAICNFLIDKGFKLHVKDTHTWVYTKQKKSFYYKLDIFVSYFNKDKNYEITYGYHGRPLKESPNFFNYIDINLSNNLISVPVNYKDILRQLYGDSWQVPDPGFQHTEKTRQWNKKYHLSLKQVSSLYWKQFYVDAHIRKNSLFSIFINKYLSKRSNIIELGCGNGEDAFYFHKCGHFVSTCDQSTNVLKNKEILSKINFSNFDVGDSVKLNAFLNKSLIKKIDGSSMVNMIYMRFFLHSVTKDVENIIFLCLKKNLPQGSLVGMEFRTEKDKDALHIFKRHYRRFIPMQEMINKIEKYDFSILYSKESKGFSPFKDEDPFLCRIIAKKM